MSFLLKEFLLEPDRIVGLEASGLKQLVPQARSARLLASLALELERVGVLTEVPPAARRHFDSAVLIHEKQRRDLAYDCNKLKTILAGIGVKLVLLKGGAYLQAGIPVSRGRLISDIDIIVPRHQLELVEQTLNQFGWESSYTDSYNERYYREWMHEIPPLFNRERRTTLDLHHTILPPTASADIDADLLFDKLMEVKPGIFTLQWQDMVIHSATHLFHEGEFHHGLRDLWDLDRMLRDFPGRDPRFWDELIERAKALDLLGSLCHGLTYTQQVFSTPIPRDVMDQATNWSRSLRRPIMDFLFTRAFRPNQPECRLPLTGLALDILYIRSHYLRMPMYLLIPHLTRKAWMSRFDKPTKPQEVTEAA